MSKLQEKYQEFVQILRTKLEENDERLISVTTDVQGGIILTLTNNRNIDKYCVYEDIYGVTFIRIFGG